LPGACSRSRARKPMADVIPADNPRREQHPTDGSSPDSTEASIKKLAAYLLSQHAHKRQNITTRMIEALSELLDEAIAGISGSRATSLSLLRQRTHTLLINHAEELTRKLDECAMVALAAQSDLEEMQAQVRAELKASLNTSLTGYERECERLAATIAAEAASDAKRQCTEVWASVGRASMQWDAR